MFDVWKRAKENTPDGTIVLVSVGEGSAVTFSLSVATLGPWYTPFYMNVAAATERLNEMGIPWVLVNAPDEVAAACGVPTD